MSKIAVSSPASGTATYTISAPAGSTDRTINLPDSNGTILTTATAGVPIGGPAFSATMSANQSVTTSTYTKVVFNTEEFDTNSNYDTTLYRFTPTVAGYYQVTGAVYPNTAVSGINAAIYKNGSSAKVFGGTTTSAAVSALIYLNGSTDYIELYGYLVGASPAILSTSTVSYFQAVLVRSAT